MDILVRMKFIEIYNPKPNEIIYHYCNSDAFNSICQNKTIRLSDLFSMNDSMEIKYGYSIWIEVANLLIKEFGREFIDEIDKIIHGFGLHSLSIAASFSKEGDLLSQWRAYASDGCGYCIGFLAKDILRLPVFPVRIEYNKKTQIKKVLDSVSYIYNTISSSKKKYGKTFIELCFFLTTFLASMKNPLFKEEKEIRLIHLLTFEEINGNARLLDNGGYSFGHEVFGQKINFRFKENYPVAYQDYDFTNNNKINPIKEIIIGPKNNALLTGISIYLETIGLSKVNILKSNLTYN